MPSPPPDTSVIELRALSCRRPAADGESAAEVRRLSAAFTPGTLTFLRGPAVADKALLLRLVGLLETPDAGEILLRGRATRGLDEAARAALRSRTFGFVFAAPFLLPAFSVIENVAVPLFKLARATPEEARARAEEALAFTGLADRAQTPAADLDSAAQHGVALARALATRPVALLVEEVDTALAGDALGKFAGLLRAATQRLGITVLATVSPAFSPASQDRCLELTAAHILPSAQAVPTV